jgi:hypothetical protein
MKVSIGFKEDEIRPTDLWKLDFKNINPVEKQYNRRPKNHLELIMDKIKTAE